MPFLHRASNLQASRSTVPRPTSSKFFDFAVPACRMSGSTVRTARNVVRSNKGMRGRRPRRWRSGWRKAKRVLKKKTVFQVLIHRKRGSRVLSIGSSRAEIQSTPPQVASSETLGSSQNRHSATPSIIRTLPSQNGRVTYTIHYGRNGSASSLPVKGSRNTLRFSHPLVNAVIPTPSPPPALTPITPTPYSDGYEPAWSNNQPSQTTSRESTSSSITPTSAQFNGQVKPEAVAGDHVRNSAMDLTVPQALNQLDGVPSSLRDRVELPRSVNQRVSKSRRPSCDGRRHGQHQTTASSLYLAKPLPFDARALTGDLEQCNGETNSADVERQNALIALEGESTVPESPWPSERRQRRELAPSSLYLARPYPFDANRLTQDLERCNGQDVPCEESRQNALQALEGSMPAKNSPDLGPLLQKYVADAKKQDKRATQYPGKETYGQKRYTAFHPSMLPEPLRTSQNNRPIARVVSPPADSAIAGIDIGKRPTGRQAEQNLDKARKRQFMNDSARDFSVLQVEQLGSHFAVEQGTARPVRKSRLDHSLPPALPASPPSPHRKSVVLDNGYPPFPDASLQHVKRKPVNATKPPPLPPPPHLPSAPQMGVSTKAQIEMYTEMARLHQEQSRLLKQYAEDLSRQFPSPVQQGGINWKRTVKRAIMKDW